MKILARLYKNGTLALKGNLIEAPPKQVLSFDGVDDTIDNVGINNFNWNEGTWEFWIRIRTDFANLPTNYYESLFGVEQYSPSFRLRVYARGSDRFYFTFVSRGGSIRFPISRLTKDEWHHIAITYSAINGQMESYVDGVRASTSSFAYSDVVLNTPFSIGKTLSYSNFNGDMKEFRVWNKALTQTEIQENMNKSLIGSEEGLVSYFPMNQIEEEILTDKSGNGNDGVINGATFMVDDSVINKKITFDNDGNLFTTIELTEKEEALDFALRIKENQIIVSKLIENADL